MKHWIVGLLLSSLVVGYANASLPISSPMNRPLSAEQIAKYKDRSWEPGVGYAQITEERRRKYDFDRALQYGQYADAWQLIKGRDVLFSKNHGSGLAEPLQEEMAWSKGTHEDYIPLTTLGGTLVKPAKKGAAGGSTGGFTVFDRVYYQKSKLGIVWSSQDYTSVYALVKEAVEQLVKRKDLHLKELYALKVFLDDRGLMYDEQQPPEKTTSCDLWQHKYVLQNKKPPTTETQRKAIRLWMIQTLNEGAEKVLANPNRFSESGLLNIGSMFPSIIELRVSNVSAGCRLSRENGAIQPRPPLHYFCESL